MLLKPPFFIAPTKLTHYLLVPLAKDDKSNYLRLAGYSLDNWPVLEADLLSLIESTEAVFERQTDYGITYSVSGGLTGPNGRIIQIKTIWMWDEDEEITKFITLYPPNT